jgi:hypothetical protein
MREGGLGLKIRQNFQPVFLPLAYQLLVRDIVRLLLPLARLGPGP